MPNLHDIERRINSVASTKQITRTMEMVAAAKIRRATERVTNALPWSLAISDMIVSTARYAQLDIEPLLMTHPEMKRSLVVVMASDRGLAGGFNSNVLRHAENLIHERERSGLEVDVIACGKKAIGYFAYRHIVPVLEFKDRSADPTYSQAIEIAHYAGHGYAEGDYDEVYIVYNHAKNAAEQRLIEQKLLPITGQTYTQLLGIPPKKEHSVFDGFIEPEVASYPSDVDFEPDPQTVLTHLMRTYLRNSFFFALLDSAAGEQGARRNAMKSATDNATDMVATLTRMYNRARQGAITTEISEIVGGAAALEDE